MNKTRILIADDHSLVRTGLASLIGYQKDMEVVGEAENGEMAVARAQALKPDVVIMDIIMPKLDGASATAQILAALPSVKVFILTSFSSSADLLKAVVAGATGAFLKDAPNDQLLDAIRKVARGGKVIQREIQLQMDEAPSLLSLSPRQLDILQSASCGFSTSDIARQMGISQDGIKKHIAAICDRHPPAAAEGLIQELRCGLLSGCPLS